MNDIQERHAAEITPRFENGPRISDEEFDLAVSAPKTDRVYLGHNLWLHRYCDADGDVVAVKLEGYHHRFEIYKPYCGNYANGMDLKILLAPSDAVEKHRIRRRDYVTLPVSDLTEEQMIRYVKDPNAAP